MQSALSVSGNVKPGSGTILSTYVISQDSTNISIDIPVDKVIDSAEVVKDPEGQDPGTYIKIKIQNVDGPKFIPVPTLVNTYEGVSSDTITTDAREIYDKETSSYSYKISAYVNDGSIEQKHLTTGLSGEISGLRTDIDSISSQVSSYTNDWKAAVDISVAGLDSKIDAEAEHTKAAEGYLSGQISSLSDGFETWKTGTYAPDKATLEAADSYISGIVDSLSDSLSNYALSSDVSGIKDELTKADSYISGKVDAKTTETEIRKLIHDTMDQYLSDYEDLNQVPLGNMAKAISALYKLHPVA